MVLAKGLPQFPRKLCGMSKGGAATASPATKIQKYILYDYTKFLCVCVKYRAGHPVLSE
jgi:hypothetical protein